MVCRHKKSQSLKFEFSKSKIAVTGGFKKFLKPGGSGPAVSYLEPGIDFNTYISYKDLLLQDILVFWQDKMFCFSQNIIFALYLYDPARFAGILKLLLVTGNFQIFLKKLDLQYLTCGSDNF